MQGTPRPALVARESTRAPGGTSSRGALPYFKLTLYFLHSCRIFFRQLPSFWLEKGLILQNLLFSDQNDGNCVKNRRQLSGNWPATIRQLPATVQKIGSTKRGGPPFAWLAGPSSTTLGCCNCWYRCCYGEVSSASMAPPTSTVPDTYAITINRRPQHVYCSAHSHYERSQQTFEGYRGFRGKKKNAHLECGLKLAKPPGPNFKVRGVRPRGVRAVAK